METGSRLLTTADPDQWDRIFGSLSEDFRDIHFTARYHRMYEANGDGDARLFCYESQGHCFLYPFMLRPVPAGLSEKTCYDITSAYGYSGPLSDSDSPQFFAEADMAFRSWCRENKIITEFVRFHPLIRNDKILSSAVDMDVIHLRDYVAVEVDSDESVQWDQYASRCRNSIRKAINERISIVVADSIDAFTKIYLDNMRQLNAAPMYFFSGPFFKSLETIALSDGLILVAMHDGAPVGAAVFLAHGNYGHYYLASANATGRSLSAGNLLLHEGINQLRNRGVKRIHLGGGLSGSTDDPLLNFKLSFSKNRVPYFIGRRIHDNVAYESIVSRWAESFPGLAKEHSGQLQCYRLS